MQESAAAGCWARANYPLMPVPWPSHGGRYDHATVPRAALTPDDRLVVVVRILGTRPTILNFVGARLGVVASKSVFTQVCPHKSKKPRVPLDFISCPASWGS
jgi:hypothetical protein